MEYPIEHGNIEIKEDHLVITDNAKMGNRLMMFLSVMMVLQGVIHICLWVKQGGIEDGIDYVYIPCLIAGALLLVNTFRFTAVPDIAFKEIKSAKFIKRFGNEWIDLHLEMGKIRRVVAPKHIHRILSERLV